jgi:FkbM family methyltransferase
MEIVKNEHKFKVIGRYSENWFANDRLNIWEQETFYILDHYSNREINNVYVDIGAWIGPTVLYAASIYNKIIALEPDPVAFSRLEKNVLLNSFNNITLCKKALSNLNGHSLFGGNGELGNSESTLLVSFKDYCSWGGENGGRWNESERKSNIIETETITLDTLLEEHNINPKDISLIKMDIEGGEFIVIPHLKEFLKKYKPTFYISLHYCFLKYEQVLFIVQTLFEIYNDCFIFTSNGNKIKKTVVEVIDQKLTSLVFEK